MKKNIIFLSFLFLIMFYGKAYSMTYEETQKAADVTVTKNHANAVKDPSYPKYHLRAPSGWINDPCGMFYFNSSFHIFCQSNPWGTQWGNMTWSHMVSVPDKKFSFKWFYPEYKDGTLKVSAILPSLNNKAADKSGIFTGCAEVLPFVEKNKEGKDVTVYYPTVFYSAVWGISEEKQEVICMARALDACKVSADGALSDPYLTDWTKYSHNDNDKNDNPAVLIKQPKELNLISFRDPYHVDLSDDDNFYLCVSGGVIDKSGKPKGVLLLFENDGKDITKNWKRVNKENNYFFEVDTNVKDAVTGGGDIECGAVYRLTDHIGTTNDTPYIVIWGQDSSPNEPYGKSVFYALGNVVKDVNGVKFVPLKNFINIDGKVVAKHIDLNPDFIFYASNTINIDNEQRKYLIGWLNIESQAENRGQLKWAGALSIPRFLFAYKEDNIWKLGQEPVLVNALREKLLLDKKASIKKGEAVDVSEIEGRFLNIDTVFEGDNLINKNFGVEVACVNGNGNKIAISKGKLKVSDKEEIDLGLKDNAEKVELNIYLDGSTMEIFISKEVNNTFIPYEVYSSSLPNNGSLEGNKVKLFGDDLLANIKAYEMDTCWEKQPGGKTE